MKSNLLLKDYYGMLEVDRTASHDVIRSAFRRSALLTHPDATGKSGDYERFILVREAFDVLTNPVKKKEYDRLWDIVHRDGMEKVLSPDDLFNQAQANFSDVMGEGYRDEWEMFVRDPDEYMTFFDSLWKIAAASVVSAVAGMGVTFFMIIAIVVFSLASLLAAASFVSALMISWPLSMVLMIFIVRVFGIIWKRMDSLRKFIVAKLGEMILHPLQGIPRQVGKWIFNFNYLSAVLLFIILITRLVLDEATRFIDSAGPVIPLITSVLFFSMVLPLIFEVIKAALIRYPPVTYSRFTIKNQKNITFGKNIHLPGPNDD